MSIAKAGIVCTLPARTTVVTAANPSKGPLIPLQVYFCLFVFFWFVCAQFGSIESCTGFAGFYLSRAVAWSLLAIRDVRSWDMSLTLAQNLKLGSNDVQHSCLGRALGPFFVWFS